VDYKERFNELKSNVARFLNENYILAVAVSGVLTLLFAVLII